MLYEDVDFKTLSGRYTNSRMIPFLSHIDGVRANLFSINPRQKMTPTMVNQQLFFYRIIGCNKLFPSNTAEVRPIYLKMGHIMRKPVLSYVKPKAQRRSACASTLHRFCFPVSIFVINLFDRNKRFCDFWNTDF